MAKMLAKDKILAEILTEILTQIYANILASNLAKICKARERKM